MKWRRHRIDREVPRPQVILDRTGQRHQVQVHVIGGQQDANAPALRVEREAVSCERLGDVRAQFERVGRDCYVEVLYLLS